SAEMGTDNAYGRVVRDANGDVARVVETKHATGDEKRLPESNLGAYAADLSWLRGAVAKLKANATGEIFLTDLVALATGEGKKVGGGTRIGPYSILRDTTVGASCTVEASVLEGATLEDDVRIGPFSHLRPGAYLEQGVQMGNYGEVKAARLGAGTKMHHFGYVGDASIGKRVNIGAGTITMNYTAKRTKERTEIGDDAFIGSDSLLRAPVRVGH